MKFGSFSSQFHRLCWCWSHCGKTCSLVGATLVNARPHNGQEARISRSFTTSLSILRDIILGSVAARRLQKHKTTASIASPKPVATQARMWQRGYGGS
jgi:hypothetical protein